MRLAVLIVGVLALAPQPSEAAQAVRARVVDRDSRTGIADAAVTVVAMSGDTVARARSNAEGFFTFDVSAQGRYTVLIEHLGYGVVEHSVEIPGRDTTLPAFVLQSQAIRLDSVEVTARADDRAAVGFSRPSHVISGARMAMLERQGARVQTVIRELPGVRMRNLSLYVDENGTRIRNYTCMESTRRVMRMQQRPCEPMVLVIDDIPVGDPHVGTRSLNLSDVESIEFLTPTEAGQRFGLQAGSVGALVIWTRGRGPHKNAERSEGH